MTEYIYGVALNGTCTEPVKYRVVQETPARYIIDRPHNNFIMIDRWESYFVDESSAKAFLDSLLKSIEKMSRYFDYKYVYDMLIEFRENPGAIDRLDTVIEYVKGFM